MGCSADGVFCRWGVLQMGCSADGVFCRWGVLQMGCSADLIPQELDLLTFNSNIVFSGLQIQVITHHICHTKIRFNIDQDTIMIIVVGNSSGHTYNTKNNIH